MSTLKGANIVRDIDDLIDRRQCSLGFVKERSPFLSANQPLALPRKQLEPELFFQVADQTAHGRLRHAQTVRGRGDRPGLVNSAKSLQPLEVHILPPHIEMT